MEKEIYIALTGRVDSISIPTTNYTEDELVTVDKFLKDLNAHIPDGCRIDAIVIIGDQD